MKGQVKNLSFMNLYNENVSQYFIHHYCLIKIKINPIIPLYSKSFHFRVTVFNKFNGLNENNSK